MKVLIEQEAATLAYDDAAFEEAVRRRGLKTSPPTRGAKPGEIVASPYHRKDPALLPRRQPLYGRSFYRKYLTVTVAPGGVGKSSLAIVEALALVTGRPLLGKNVERPMRVWIWNLEDPFEELELRIEAACWHYNISAEETEGRLFVDSGREFPLMTAVMGAKNKVILQRPIIDQLTAELKRRQIDMLVIDPFVSSHMVPENDNGAMDAVAKEWSKVADAANCSIHLVHHTRKLGSDAEVTAESSRGGKALTDAAREVRAVNRMSDSEGTKFGVENHRAFFRVYSDKANMAPPAELSDWYQIENVKLPNGDHVGVVTSWEPPKPFDDVKPEHLLAVQRMVSNSDFRADARSENWVGHAIASVIGLDLDDAADLQKAKQILNTWLKNGALKKVRKADEKSRQRDFVEVGEWSSE